MHQALEVQEILLLIFSHCREPTWLYLWKKPGRDLCSLARTCRTFKEPALDVIWEELVDVAPLARCLPQVCQFSYYYGYTFTRPLTLIEWGTLRSYTRRIRYILDFKGGLDAKSLTILSNPPTTEPLFPNLRYLQCQCRDESTHLLRFPLPSLARLHIASDNPDWIRDSLKLLPELSPNIRNLSISVDQPNVAFGELVSSCIRQWRNLQLVSCHQVAMDANTLVHLSRMPTLRRLYFSLHATLAYIDSPLSFFTLRESEIYSGSLPPISQSLSRIKLPVIIHFAAFIKCCPSKQQLSAFWASFQTSSTGHFIESFELCQHTTSQNIVRSGVPLLDLEDLRPCMAFHNLRQLWINLGWNVCLTDSQFLELAPAWPYLEDFRINPNQGWNTLGGITPHGLLQLLQTCRSLCRVFLVIDTRGYTEPPEKGLLTSVGFTPDSLLLNVLDSAIEEASVPAMAAFLRSTRSAYVMINDGICSGMDAIIVPGSEAYYHRWMEVKDLLYDLEMDGGDG